MVHGSNGRDGLPYSHLTKDNISFPSVEIRRRVGEAERLVKSAIPSMSTAIRRPSGVNDGQIIMKDHDLDMLEIMFGRSEQPERPHKVD
ncbi:1585_t:CDS:2 [Paraglomus brasilianum]|uniref:1585_t:CDS:1 n=1 Tax=Paraglomus brasilianum TaxID=144538 RepID=A0A9N9GEJ2_9GLOM|nr:1585_t:CDS:2 [Paraglomus brasilianum]